MNGLIYKMTSLYLINKVCINTRFWKEIAKKLPFIDFILCTEFIILWAIRNYHHIYIYDCKSLIKRQILFRIYLSDLFFFNSFSILSMLDLSEI